MKYVMIETKTGDLTIKIPIIFPDLLVHKHVASVIEILIKQEYRMECKVVSAGNVSLEVNSAFGKSTTLEMGVKNGDCRIMNRYDYEHGIIL